MTYYPKLFIYTFCFGISNFISKTRGLGPYGCEDGWFNFKEHCYRVVLNETSFQDARSECLESYADLASVWSRDEEESLISYWQFPRRLPGFLWVGLMKGAFDSTWKFSDQSFTNGSWSLLEGVSSAHASTDKCVALSPSATVALLDCNNHTSAYVCKKALPKLYITPGFVNRTQLPTPSRPLNHAQTFQRMYPPRLKAFPEIEGDSLADVTVDDEAGCAYACLRYF